MTRRRHTHEKADRQREIIAALRETGGGHIADRLQRCMEVRLSRRRDAGWPPVCKTIAGCIWCGPAQARRWWHGIRRWIVQDGAPVSLAVLPLPRHPQGLRAAVARLRRALRDVRDRTARRSWRWRGVAIAGMAGGNGKAVLLGRHPGIAPTEVADVLRKRWRSVAVSDAGAVSPCWDFEVEDAVELAGARRGVEPLRVVVLAQKADADAGQRTAESALPLHIEPMPVAF